MDQGIGTKYDKYLEHLTGDVRNLRDDIQIIFRLWEIYPDYREDLKDVSGIFESISRAYITSTVVLLHRLFDHRSEVNLCELIRIAQKHSCEIKWERSAPKPPELEAQLNEIGKLDTPLNRLKTNRDKYYAHLDKKSVFGEHFPLSKNDIKLAIDLAYSILQEHHLWRYNVSYSMGVTSPHEMNHLLNLIRIGQKSRITEDSPNRQQGAV